ncbi:hypothetical protein PMZ80_000808 [Knufia obscura]|uniref:Protein kinase domain-containing protein n=1 Tax=Knufia obscura TaxID=1635080 RepID=A0ABR0S1F5_9EURO|nr:hypothetical protein PMZ80_000808 [Knufia obscura]
MEMLIRIAQFSIGADKVRHSSTPVQQYPSKISIDMTMAGIDKRSRQAFLEAVREEYVFVRLTFYGGLGCEVQTLRAHSQQADLYQQADPYARVREQLEHYSLHSPSAAVLLPHLLNYSEARAISLVDVVLDEHHGLTYDFPADKPLDAAAQVTFLADRFGTLLMCLALQHYLGVLHGNKLSFKAATIRAPPTSRTAVARQCIHKYQLTVVREAVAGGRPVHEILPVTFEALYWFHTKIDTPALASHNDNKILQYFSNIFNGLAMKGLANYLLLNKNIPHLQSHFLLKDGTLAFTVTQRLLFQTRALTVDLRAYVINEQEYTNIEAFEALFQMAQARAEVSLALARAASLPGSSISPLVRVAEAHTQSRRAPGLSAADHLQHARLIHSIIRARAQRVVSDPVVSRLKMDIKALFQWIDEFDRMRREIVFAIVDRGEDMQREILVEPMPKLARFGFTIRLPEDL